jgi:hypothetical protein
MKRLLTVALVLAAGVLPGCLERKEKVTVQRNGAVEIAITYTGDPADFLGGDPLPEPASGWESRDEKVVKQDGKEEQTRTAVRRFAPQQPLPETYAEPGTPEVETALQLPTEVKIERRPDGTYYHFARRYVDRQNARFAYHKEAAAQRYGKLEDIIGSRDFNQLSPEEQHKVFASLRYVELQRRLDDVYDAAADLPWSQDLPLTLEADLRQYFEQVDPPLVEALSEPASEQRDRRIQQLADDFVRGAREHLEAKLGDLKIAAGERERFFTALDTAEQRRAFTEDLADERWVIELSLPGELVAHNADRLENGRLIWEFSSEAFFDRDHRLLATSRVSRNAATPAAAE